MQQHRSSPIRLTSNSGNNQRGRSLAAVIAIVLSMYKNMRGKIQSLHARTKRPRPPNHPIHKLRKYRIFCFSTDSGIHTEIERKFKLFDLWIRYYHPACFVAERSASQVHQPHHHHHHHHQQQPHHVADNYNLLHHMHRCYRTSHHTCNRERAWQTRGASPSEN